ncbi:MAG: hypothetical protein DM484_02565, partial [Candidatus Methylumidiphilus alinenensis]
MATNRNTEFSYRLHPIVLGLQLVITGAAMAGPAPTALPTGGQVVSGQATISQPGAAQLQINQATQQATLNWQTFNIGSAAQVNFQQPNASSVALNRVLQSDASVIEGKLTANGQVFLVNPGGVIFGKTAQVDVGGLVATTMNISDKDFANGNYHFTRDGSAAAVVNNGQITAANGGYVALIGATVVNNGTITANHGTVALAAGDGATLQFNGGNLVNIQVDPGTVKTLIQNNQLIQAPDGQVLMTAAAASALQGAVINNSGTVEANSITSSGGVIRLTGANEIDNSGTLDASGKTTGGTVQLAAASTINQSGTIDASGAAVGGSVTLAAATNTPLPSGGEGTINQSGIIKASSSTGSGGNVTLTAASGIANSGTIDASGATAGGSVAIQAVDAISQSGTVTAASSSGNGGSVTLTATSGIDNSGTIDASGATAGGNVTVALTPATTQTTPQSDPVVAANPVLNAAPGPIVHQGGTIHADSLYGVGGQVVLAGEYLQLDNGSLTTATGAIGGGAIYAGGGQHGAQIPLGVGLELNAQGQGLSIANATYTRVEQGATLDASSTNTGNGGTIVAWGESASRAYGTLNATGGPNGGNGGTVETSGHWLDVTGVKVDTSAAQGKAGVWLLDPWNVYIEDNGGTSGPGSFGSNVWNPSGTDSIIDTTTLVGMLKGGATVTVSTTQTPTDIGNQVGSITIQSALDTTGNTGGATLNLLADSQITVGASVTGTVANPLSLNLQSGLNQSSVAGGTTATINLNGNIATGGGSVSISTGTGSTEGSVYLSSLIDTSAGNGGISVTTHAKDGSNASIVTYSGSGFKTGSGNISLTTNTSGISNANITTDSLSTVDSGTGNITIATNNPTGEARIISNAPITTTGGNVVLTSVTSGGITGAGAIWVTGNMSTSGGNITLGGGDVNGSGYAVASGTYSGIKVNAAVPTGTVTLDAGGGDIVLRGENSQGGTYGGVQLGNSSGNTETIITKGAGTVTLDGWNQAGTGISLFNGTNIISTVNGLIKLTGKSDATNLGGISNVGNTQALTLVSSTGGISLTGNTAGTATGPGIRLVTGTVNIGTNGTTTTSGNIDITAIGKGGVSLTPTTALSIATTGAGSTPNVGNITVDAGAGSLFLNGPAGKATVNAGGTNTDPTSGTITLKAATDIVVGKAATLSSASLTTQGKAILLASDTGGTGTGGISMFGASLVSNGGNITLGGGTDPLGKLGTPTFAGGLSTSANYIAGSTAANMGISIGAGSTLSAGGGNIVLRGQANSSDASSLNKGIQLISYTASAPLTISTSGTGSITLLGNGASNATGGSNSGVYFNGSSSNVIVTTVNGDINVTGKGGGTGNSTDNTGIYDAGSVTLQATGSGSINLSGKAGNNAASLGINHQTGSVISTNTGAINLSAVTPTVVGPATASFQGIMQSTGGGNITLTADTMAFGTPNSPTVSSAGWLLLQPTANNTDIGIGGGTLNLAPGLFSGANQVFKTGFNYIQIGNTSDAGGITVSAVTTVNDDLRLVEGSGSIAINSGLTLANPKTLLLQTTGGGTETGGSIIASGLQLLGSGANYVLGSTSNQITTLAGSTGSVDFTNDQGYAVGTVTNGTLVATQISTTGITTTAGDIALHKGATSAVGNIAINAAVNSGSSNVVLDVSGINAGVGSGSTQTVAITANGLTLLGTGSHTLNSSNAVSVLAGAGTAGGTTGTGTIQFTDSQALSIGSLSHASVTTNGLRTSGDITLNITGGLTQSQLLGVAGTLSGSAASVNLNNTSNTVSTLGSFTATGAFALTDNTALSVSGPVSGSSVTLTTTTGNGLTLAGNVIGNAGGTVTLDSGAAIQQNSGAITTTGTLTGYTTGAGNAATLNSNTNAVGTLGSFAATGAFALTDNTALSVSGPVSGSSVTLTTTTGNGLTLAGNVTGNAGGTVTLDSGAAIQQNSGAITTTGTLTGYTTGAGNAATLNSNTNAVGTLGSFAATGAFALTDNSALSVSGPVSGSSVALTTTTGNGLTLAGNVTGNAGGTVTLDSGAAILQNSGAITTTGILTGYTTGTGNAATLNSNTNAVGTLGSFAATGAFALTDNTALSVSGPVSGSSVTLTTTASNGLTLAGNVTGNAGGTVTLDSGAAIQQNSGAITTTGTLTGYTTGAGNAATLNNNTNAIANLGAFSTQGAFTLNDNYTASPGLTVTGTVTTNKAGDAKITNTGALTVASTGSVIGSNITLATTTTGSNITLNGAVTDALASTVTLNSAGNISQSSTGIITAINLVGNIGTTAELYSANNVITNLGTFTTGGDFALKDTNNAGLNITGTVNSGTGSVVLNSTSGGITENSGGSITTGTGANTGLLLLGTGIFDLYTNGSSNSVPILAAYTTGTSSIQFKDSYSSGLVVGTVNDTLSGTTAPQNKGISTSGLVRLVTTLGDINGDGVATPNLNSARITTTDTTAAGGVILNAAGGIGIVAPVYTTTTAGNASTGTLLKLTSNGDGAKGNISLIEDNTLNTSRINLGINGTSTAGTNTDGTSKRILVTLGTLANNTFIVDSKIGFSNVDLTLNSPNSNIVNPSGSGPFTVTANTLTLQAGGTIGGTDAGGGTVTGTAPIQTAAAVINAISSDAALGGTASLGGIYLLNNQTTTLTALATTFGASSGAIKVGNTTGMLTIGSGGVASQYNTVNLYDSSTATTDGITLASGSTVTGYNATLGGTAVTLSADQLFVNNSGSGAVSVNAGAQWLVYSADPTKDTFGVGSILSSGNIAQWHVSYADIPSTS